MHSISILQNGNTAMHLCKIDHENRYIFTKEPNLIINIKNNSAGWVIKTSQRCEIIVGDGCTVICGNECTISAGSNCNVHTGYNCSVLVNYYCTITTQDNCKIFSMGRRSTIKGGDKCTVVITGGSSHVVSGHNSTIDVGSFCTIQSGAYCKISCESECELHTGRGCDITSDGGCYFSVMGNSTILPSGFNCTLRHRALDDVTNNTYRLIPHVRAKTKHDLAMDGIMVNVNDYATHCLEPEEGLIFVIQQEDEWISSESIHL